MYKDIVEEVKVAYEEVSEYPEESELKAFYNTLSDIISKYEKIRG